MLSWKESLEPYGSLPQSLLEYFFGIMNSWMLHAGIMGSKFFCNYSFSHIFNDWKAFVSSSLGGVLIPQPLGCLSFSVFFNILVSYKKEKKVKDHVIPCYLPTPLNPSKNSTISLKPNTLHGHEEKSLLENSVLFMKESE